MTTVGVKMNQKPWIVSLVNYPATSVGAVTDVQEQRAKHAEVYGTREVTVQTIFIVIMTSFLA